MIHVLLANFSQETSQPYNPQIGVFFYRNSNDSKNVSLKVCGS